VAGGGVAEAGDDETVFGAAGWDGTSTGSAFRGDADSFAGAAAALGVVGSGVAGSGVIRSGVPGSGVPGLGRVASAGARTGGPVTTGGGAYGDSGGAGRRRVSSANRSAAARVRQ